MLGNLSYLLPSATVAEVTEAVEAIGAGNLIERIGGLAAAVKPGELSAGEKQLLALVRAYLSPAPLVVLDEATSFLDPESERQAEEAFAKRDGTLIVIAHRIRSALRAKRILVLDGNKAALGTHVSLMRNSRMYRDGREPLGSPLLPPSHPLPHPPVLAVAAAKTSCRTAVPVLRSTSELPGWHA